MAKKLIAFFISIAAAIALGLGITQLPSVLFAVGARPAPGQTMEVKPKNLQLVCPGSAFASAGGNGANANNFNRIGAAVVNYSDNLPAGVSLKRQPLTGPAASLVAAGDSQGVIASDSSVSAVAYTVDDQTGKAAQGGQLFTAQSTELASSSGVVGALGANCQNPSPELWLVGGVTTVGRESLLVLANPGSTDATVNLEIFGSNGLINGAGLSGISISANRTLVLPLAGFAPNEGSLAVHVVSQGASLAAWIQQRTVRGTVAAGADWISPAAPAAVAQTIPGLLVRGSADAAALIGANADYADTVPSVQVFVPGTQAATVTVQVIGSNSKSTGTVRQEQVGGGSTAAVDLPGLGDGDYAIFVISDQPILAGAKLSRTKQGGTPVTDFAWLPSVAPSTTPGFTTTAKSAVAKLSIANPSAAVAKVTLVNRADGSTQTVSVSHLGSAVVSVAAGGVIGITSDQPVSATLVSDFSGQITATAVENAKNVGGQIAVAVH